MAKWNASTGVATRNSEALTFIARNFSYSRPPIDLFYSPDPGRFSSGNSNSPFLITINPKFNFVYLFLLFLWFLIYYLLALHFSDCLQLHFPNLLLIILNFILSSFFSCCEHLVTLSGFILLINVEFLF